MTISKSEKEELLEKLNLLIEKQSIFQKEINELNFLIATLQADELENTTTGNSIPESKTQSPEDKKVHKLPEQTPSPQKKTKKRKKSKSELGIEIEKFIGENLISKIGIGVLIIGVGIGAKYAIDNNLISPLVRIILGYLVGFALNFFAWRSKKKYYNFSAVLASGAMAIHYFITYAAFTYYGLIPQTLTFILMVFITVITVALALYYNRQVIAHFGLVGAYVVPFLLKDPDSSIVVLLVYMTIVNCGILYISTKKRWKPLNYLAFISTWVIFMTWFSSKEYNEQLGLSLTFSTIFFALFLLVFLSYKLILKEKLRIDDIIFLLLNSGVFYFVGIIALNMSDLSDKYAGLFTFINAAIHAATAYLIYRTEKENKNLFYWTLGLVVAFFTISIPIQFNNYLTAILWAAEAFAIYWYGRTKKIPFFEIASYIIVSLLFFVVVSNWPSVSYSFHKEEIETIHPLLLNFTFISSLVVIAFISAFIYVQLKINSSEDKSFGLRNFFNLAMPVILIFFIFFTFFTEISLYWNNVQIKTCFEQNGDGTWIKQYDDLNQDVFRFKSVWLINYSLLFVSLFSFINFRWFQNLYLSAINLLFTGILILVFLASGLTLFAELRENYLNPILIPNYDASIFHLLIRYVSYLFFAVLIYTFYRFVIPLLKLEVYKIIFEVTLSIIIVILCSSELVNILNLTGSEEVYKHGLSILWGVFSFLLIGYGIWKKNKYLRITAIVLFAITLIKLFFYDLSNLSTVQKTIVFILVGALLLVVSFMYNKYKHVIFEES